LREKYGSASSCGAASSGGGAGPLGSGARSLRASQEGLVRGSQEAFKHYARGELMWHEVAGSQVDVAGA
jgi:hypothetical protein